MVSTQLSSSSASSIPFRNRLNGLQIVSKKSCFPFCIYADPNLYLTWMVGITKHFPQLEHKITYITG